MSKGIILDFGGMVNSAVAGVARSEPRAFQPVLGGLGLLPSEALLVDDKPRNVAAAEALGTSSLLFQSAGQLDLRASELLP